MSNFMLITIQLFGSVVNVIGTRAQHKRKYFGIGTKGSKRRPPKFLFPQ